MKYAVAMLFLLAVSVSAQISDSVCREEPGSRTQFGLYGRVNVHIEQAQFSSLPSVPTCCIGYNSTSGSGFALGALLQHPITNQLHAHLKVGIGTFKSTFDASKKVPFVFTQGGVDSLIELPLLYNLRTERTMLSIEPALGYYITKSLRAQVGLNVAFPLASSYNQTDKVETNSVVFTESQLPTRLTFGGTAIPNLVSTMLQATATVGYDIPLNARKTLLLAPELTIAYGINNVVQSIDWKTHTIGLGFALKQTSTPPKIVFYDTLRYSDTNTIIIRYGTPTVQHIKTKERLDSIETETSITYTTTYQSYFRKDSLKPIELQASIEAVAVEDDGTEQKVAQMRIEEFSGTSTHPLLMYVFFDEKSSTIPDRYIQLNAEQAIDFNVDDLYGKTNLEVYYNILNIIGKRMMRYPKARLSIVGCNAGTWEGGTIEISNARALAVKNYLSSVWGVDSKRLTLEARGLPDIRSNPALPDGQAENRRVEFITDNPKILEPVVANDTVRRTTPSTIRIKTAITSSDGIDEWSVKVMQNGRLLKQTTGKDSVPTFIDWKPTLNQAETPQFNTPVSISLDVTDNQGTHKQALTTLPTEQLTIKQKRVEKQNDTIIDKYNLILFQYGKREVGENNYPVISFIRKRIKPSSAIQILGYTDRAGSAEANKRVATARSKSVAEAIGRPDATVVPVGNDVLLFDNATPEGRQYCRTVQVNVLTPIEQEKKEKTKKPAPKK